jgi:hypothetical protein
VRGHQRLVDGGFLEPCRGASQLAVVLLPVMEALGAQQSLLAELKLLAQAAPIIPTS